MTYNAKFTKLHRGLTPINPDQDRIQYGPQLNADIRLLLPDNSYLTLNTIDTDGSVWVISDIEGWWNIAEPSIPDVPRGFGDGSFDVTGRFLARDLVVKGSVLVTKNNREDIGYASAEARERLTTAFNLVKRGAYLIVDEDIYKRASYVRLSGRPDISTVNSRGRIDFSIGLRAVDPIKYEWIDSTFSETAIYDGRYRIEIAGITKETLTQSDYNIYDPYTGQSSYSEYSGYSGVITASGTSSATTLTTSTDYTVEGFPFFAAGQDIYSSGGYLKNSKVNTATSTTVTFSNPLTGSPSSQPFILNPREENRTRSYLGNTASRISYPSKVNILNRGNNNVFCYFRIKGPLYGPATITNTTTGQVITISAPTSSLYTGSYVLDGSTISFSVGTVGDLAKVLNQNNYLDIDTKNREIRAGQFVDGVSHESAKSARGLLDPFIDWIYLQPGSNQIVFADSGAEFEEVTATLEIYWRSGWIG
jgi:hypothetical protein